MDCVRVGLVGAAVSDHPRLPEVIEAFVSRNSSVTLSSIRADRASLELLDLLSRGGLRTLTVAADGASDGLRTQIRKGITTEDLETCAETARQVGIRKIRLYVMVGLPGETDGDLDELASLVRRMAKRTSLTISISPFVPKRFTPLADAAFAGVAELKRRVSLLKRGIQGAARFRAISPRTALAEWRLSHARADSVFEVMRELGLDREQPETV